MTPAEGSVFGGVSAGSTTAFWGCIAARASEPRASKATSTPTTTNAAPASRCESVVAGLKAFTSAGLPASAAALMQCSTAAHLRVPLLTHTAYGRGEVGRPQKRASTPCAAEMSSTASKAAGDFPLDGDADGVRVPGKVIRRPVPACRAANALGLPPHPRIRGAMRNGPPAASEARTTARARPHRSGSWLLGGFARENPGIVVPRLRLALTFSAGAGSEVGRYFPGGVLARLVPRKLGRFCPFRRKWWSSSTCGQIPDAYWRVLEKRAAGAFDIAAEPVLDPNALGWVFGAGRLVPLPLPVLCGRRRD